MFIRLVQTYFANPNMMLILFSCFANKWTSDKLNHPNQNLTNFIKPEPTSSNLIKINWPQITSHNLSQNHIQPPPNKTNLNPSQSKSTNHTKPQSEPSNLMQPKPYNTNHKPILSYLLQISVCPECWYLAREWHSCWYFPITIVITKDLSHIT